MKKVIILSIIIAFGSLTAIAVSSWLLDRYGNTKTIKVQTITVKKPVAKPKEPTSTSSQVSANDQDDTVILTEPPYQTTVTKSPVGQTVTPTRNTGNEDEDEKGETEIDDD